MLGHVGTKFPTRASTVDVTGNGRTPTASGLSLGIECLQRAWRLSVHARSGGGSLALLLGPHALYEFERTLLWRYQAQARPLASVTTAAPTLSLGSRSYRPPQTAANKTNNASNQTKDQFILQINHKNRQDISAYAAKRKSRDSITNMLSVKHDLIMHTTQRMTKNCGKILFILKRS